MPIQTCDELLAEQFPNQREVCGPWLRTGELCMLYAPRGAGKSLFAMGLAYQQQPAILSQSGSRGVDLAFYITKRKCKADWFTSDCNRRRRAQFARRAAISQFGGVMIMDLCQTWERWRGAGNFSGYGGPQSARYRQLVDGGATNGRPG